MLGNGLLAIMLIVYIAGGAKVTNMNVYHRSINWIWTGYIVAVVFLTLFYVLMIAIGMCILAKKFKALNRAIFCYAFFMFIGFLVMAG